MSHFYGLAILLAFLCPVEDGTDKDKHDLSFAPRKGKTWTIRYRKESKWNYTTEDMKGETLADLTLLWRFEKKKGAKDEFTGKAEFQHVVYRGKGRKKGFDFHHDVEWTRKNGYLKGKNSEADEKWVAEEIREGITLKFDGRGTCEPGDC